MTGKPATFGGLFCVWSLGEHWQEMAGIRHCQNYVNNHSDIKWPPGRDNRASLWPPLADFVIGISPPESARLPAVRLSNGSATSANHTCESRVGAFPKVIRRGHGSESQTSDGEVFVSRSWSYCAEAPRMYLDVPLLQVARCGLLEAMAARRKRCGKGRHVSVLVILRRGPGRDSRRSAFRSGD